MNLETNIMVKTAINDHFLSDAISRTQEFMEEYSGINEKYTL